MRTATFRPRSAARPAGHTHPIRTAALAALAALAAIATCATLAGCHSADAVLGPGPVPSGTWGGPNGNLVVYADSATLDLPCAAGRIPSALGTDADGRFDSTGQWAPMAGPIGIGGFNWQSARFSGSRAGNLLTVNVRLGSGATVGPLEFKRGVMGTFPRCL